MMLTRNTQRKKNTKRSLLLIVLGMMSGNLTATGIGLLMPIIMIESLN